MEQKAFDEIKVAATNAGAAGLLGFKTGELLAATQANLEATIKRVDDDPRAWPYLVQANGAITSMEPYAARPTQIRQDVNLHDTQSFAAYVNRFKDADTVVFADQLALTFGAVLDYHKAKADDPDHTADGARWGRHRASVALLQTDEWKEWTGAHGKQMNQSAFGAWFEDRIPDIVTPDAAVIVEMARNFEAKKDVTFSGRIDPDTGSVGLRYTEDTSGVQRDGAVTVVRSFVLELVPFLGAEKVRVEARIRWNVAEGKLLLRYELIRHKYVLEAAFRAELEDVKATIADVTVVAGPMPAKG